MSWSVRGGVAVLVAAGVVLGGVGAAGAKPTKQSTSKYAKTVCGTYTNLENDITQFASSVGGLDPNSPTFQTDAGNMTTALIGKVKAAEATLQGAYPDISNGKKVGALLATNATEIEQGLTAAQQKLQAGGATGQIQFGVAIQTLGAKISDPFSKVTNQSLIGAFKKEKLCKNVVTVIG
jgi:hypothetical protein